MENLDIRVRVYDSGITYRAIADKLGVTPEYLSRLMRKPLSDKNKQRIAKALDELESRGETDGNSSI